MWPFKKKEIETRASGTGYTSQLMQLREAYITGNTGLAELTGVASSSISMWESALSVAEVQGAGDYFTPAVLGLIGRSLALRGEVLLYVSGDRLIPCSDWDLSTRAAQPTAYRVTIPEVGGGQSMTILAAEAIHIRIGCDTSQPWVGQSPLRRASLTAGLLEVLEQALSDAYASMPLGSQIVSFPESPKTDLDKLGAEFRGRRGMVLMQESTAVHAAGGPMPSTDWKPSGLTPDIQKAMTGESLAAARDSIAMAFGVLPAMFNSASAGPVIREAERHLATWTLQPLANLIAHEASQKLASPVKLDVMQPLQAFDAGLRSRSVAAVVGALAQAKEAGVDPEQALALVNWDQD